MQGSFEGVESASHAGWMSHAPPSQAKRGCGAGVLTLAINKGPALHDCCMHCVDNCRGKPLSRLSAKKCNQN